MKLHGMLSVLRRSPATCLILGFVLGGGVFALVDSYDHGYLFNFSDPRCQKEFPLTSRSLDCAEYDDSIASINALDKKLNDLADLYVKEGKARRISVWVRDLETKQWAAANEQEPFAPASLFKVPLMMTYYKFAQLDPLLLSQTIVYDKAIPVRTQDYNEPSESLVVGQSYTVDELIRRMIVDSDNVATQLLSKHIQPEAYVQTLIDLGMKIPADSGTVNFVTAKSYASMFRQLYDASYLSREYSEKALRLLSHTTYKGFTTSLPKDIVVAHKFGERSVPWPGGDLKQLHDCGIVYKGDHPYSFCVMTQGMDFDTLADVIGSIAQAVYQEL